MILKTFTKLVNCIWKQHDWWKLSHCYFWRAVFGIVLSPERSTEKEAIPFISFTEAIPYPYSCSWSIITNIAIDADLCMYISKYQIHSERCHLWCVARFGSICKKREKQPWRSVNFSKVAGFSISISIDLLWTSPLTLTCSKLTKETLEKGVKYVQS